MRQRAKAWVTEHYSIKRSKGRVATKEDITRLRLGWSSIVEASEKGCQGSEFSLKQCFC